MNPDLTLHNKEKILFVIHGLVVGGSETFFIHLVNGFKEKGYHPVVVLLSGHNPMLNRLHSDIPVHIIQRRFRYDLGVSGRVKKFIRKENISKVFCVELFSFFLCKQAFLFNSKVRFFLSVHNSIPITKKKYALDLLYLRFFQKKDTVIFVCNFQKECYRERYFFKPRKSFVIYNGIDTNHFSRQNTSEIIEPIKLDWRTALNIQENDKLIVITGRLAIEKGHLYAIKALTYLHANFGMHAHLVLVGGGEPEIEQVLHAAAEASGISKYIHFAGSQKDVRPYLYFAHLFSLTSFSETFSMAALEALSMGLPCSLTNVGGAPEMIANEEIGLLCESKNESSIAGTWNALLKKDSNKDYISSYASTSFSFEKMLQAYLTVVN